MKYHGRVVKWNSERFFGFITRADKNDSLFFHGRDLVDQVNLPIPGDLVTFEVGQGRDGRTAARNVRVM